MCDQEHERDSSNESKNGVIAPSRRDAVSDPGRRRMLLGGLFGAGFAGLRSLATGLPLAMWMRPLESWAAEGACPTPSGQFLILSTSASGDPLNANVPGTYAFPQIAHSPDPTMAKTAFALGATQVEAAKPWSTLSQPLLNRTCFIHHTTLTNNHANQSKVMRLMGGTTRQEMFASIYAKALAPCLGTVQAEPVSVGAAGDEALSFQGRTLPRLTPMGLRDVLTDPTGPLSNFQALRDNAMDELNALMKERGTPVQRRFLDRLAQTQAEARAISDDLLALLTSIRANDAANQMIAAAVLVKMRVTPVVSTHIGFGGDNHNDADLLREARETTAGVATIASLFAKVDELGMIDDVTFAAMNVFGRTLSNRGTTGRDHLANHHATVLIGKGIAPGVIGGLEPKGNEFTAQPIDSTTGRGGAGGDIAFNDTLGAVGKTLGTALGVPATVLDEQITVGKPIRAALA